MSNEQSKKRVLINVQYLGTVCKKVTNDKTKKVTFEDDYTVQSSADFIITESQSVSINRLRRVGRAVHIPHSAKITIQSDKKVFVFDCDFTAKTINVKRGQKSKRINRKTNKSNKDESAVTRWHARLRC